MTGETFFKEAKKGYDKDEVHLFIKRLSEEHRYAIEKKDDEIKALINEKTLQNEQLNEEIRRLEALLNEKTALLSESTGKYDVLCAQMGEKLLFAEQQSNAIKASAAEEKEKLVAEAKLRAEAYVERIAAEARENAASTRKAIEVLQHKNQIISASLEQTKRILDDTIEQIVRAASK